MVIIRTRELEITKDVTISAIGTLAEFRDPETGGHIFRTQNYVRILAYCLRKHPRFKQYLDAETIDLLYKSAPLHDIGKVAVPDHILLKTRNLTNEEFEAMKIHTLFYWNTFSQVSARLGEISFLRIAGEITISHHEKFDCSGYSYELNRNNIPIAGRIMALADAYDALISKRVYKPPYSHNNALQILNEGKGTHFDPDIIDAFMLVEKMIVETAIRPADTDEERENYCAKPELQGI